MPKMLQRAAIAAIAATSIVCLTPSIADAAVKNGVCEGGENCMYDSATFSFGRMYDNNSGNDGDLRNNTYVSSSVSVNNSISAIQNQTSTAFRYSDGYNGAGTSICLGTGTSTILTGGWSYFNNDTSSHYARPIC